MYKRQLRTSARTSLTTASPSLSDEYPTRKIRFMFLEVPSDASGGVAAVSYTHLHTGVGADGGQAADGVGDRRVVDRHGAADDPGSDERCGAKDPAKGEPSPPPVVGSGKAVGPKARNRGVGTTV